MPAYPIEIVNFGQPNFGVHKTVVAELNRLQADVTYLHPSNTHEAWAARFQRDAYRTSWVWERLDEFRATFRGFHPFIIAVVHGQLSSDSLGNLFGSHEAERGLAVVTTFDWSARFAPPPLDVYLAYYFVRYTLSFICPSLKNHEDTRACFFDKKNRKADVKLSMASGRICDDCREQFEYSIDGSTYASLTRLVGHIRDRTAGKELPVAKPSVFIGSSSEGLRVAEHLQLGLERVADCTIWSQGVFGLSLGTLETLVRATDQFDYAILVLTPDDVVIKRGGMGNSARDNVLFELGLFMGALGRDHVFIVQPQDEGLDLPSDLAGVTTATYRKREDNNLEAMVGPVCVRLKRAMGIQ
jgi:predicted nucleotide-binding protein